MGKKHSTCITEFASELIKFCRTQGQGTALFFKSDQEYGKLIIEGGEIVSIRYNGKSNEEALESLEKLEFVSFHFHEYWSPPQKRLNLSLADFFSRIGVPNLPTTEDKRNHLEHKNQPQTVPLALTRENALDASPQKAPPSSPEIPPQTPSPKKIEPDQVSASIKNILESLIQPETAEQILGSIDGFGRIESFTQLSHVILAIESKLRPDKIAEFKARLRQNLSIDLPTSLKRIKSAFNDAIGPISNFIYEDRASQFSSLQSFTTIRELIEQLSQEIDNDEHRREFQSKVSEMTGIYPPPSR